MTETKKRVFEIVAKYAHLEKSNDVMRAASVELNDKYDINCASAGSKAGDYLIEALNEYCPE